MTFDLNGELAGLVGALAQAGAAVIASASVLTAVTPTPRDDTLGGAVYRCLEVLALNVGRAREEPPNRRGGRFVPR